LRKNYKPRIQQPFFRINGQIFARELRVLDAIGAQIGLLTRDDALRQAQEQELDLVEIAPNAKPPVAKIIDYSKFLYQLKKKKQEEKKGVKAGETKQIQFGPFIDDHDLEIKLKKAREFIIDGDKARIVVKFRGREITRKSMGEDVLRRCIEKLSDIAKVEREIRMEGRQMVVVLSKGVSNKPKEVLPKPTTDVKTQVSENPPSISGNQE